MNFKAVLALAPPKWTSSIQTAFKTLNSKTNLPFSKHLYMQKQTCNWLSMNIHPYNCISNALTPEGKCKKQGWENTSPAFNLADMAPI